VFDIGIKAFHEEIFNKYKNVIKSIIIQKIESERDQYVVDRELIKKAVNCYIEFGKENIKFNKIFEEGGTTKIII
jgi:hypothetical protein